MESLKTDRNSWWDKLSLRMLILVLLVILYTLLAVWLGHGKWHVAALALPVGVVGLLASVRQMLPPHAVTTVGLLCYGALLLTVGFPATASLIAMSVVHVVMMVVIGLVLSEIQIMATADRAVDDALNNQDRVISLPRFQPTVAEELRRCKRHDLPMSLVLFRSTASAKQFTRADMINSVSSTTREFDQLFSLSRSELGVICLDTDRVGAKQLATRIQKNLDLDNVVIASFPEDAMTSTALIDVLKNVNPPAPQHELTASNSRVS